MLRRTGPALLLLLMIAPAAFVHGPTVRGAHVDHFVGAARAGLPTPPRPPEQPATGPGGAATTYDSVRTSRYGSPPTGYWIFSPILDDADEVGNGSDHSQLTPLPITIFFHGFTAVDPIVYQEWINHIVLRGQIVIYPDYQPVNPFGAEWDTFLPNALLAIDEAIDRLTKGHSAKMSEARIATVGHSLGGVLAIAYAAAARDQGLPSPKAVMVVQPGGCRECDERLGDDGVPMPDLANIEPSTLALVVVGDDDDVVGDGPAKLIWSKLQSIPLDQRDYVTLRSDPHGLPPLRATHFQPQTARFGGVIDALDWYGTWKFFDLLVDCTLGIVPCDDALGNTERQRFMGLWSDGKPVETPWITDHPGPPAH